MDSDQKEKLEQELNFLKESFESEVITQEEYEKGKERIERKLKELDLSFSKKPSEEQGEEQNKEKLEDTEQASEKAEEVKKEEKTEEKTEEKREEEKHKELSKEEVKTESSEKRETHKDNGKGKKKWFIFFSVLFLTGALVYISITNTADTPMQNQNTEQKAAIKTTIPKFKYTLINAKDCFNCDTLRVKNIVQSWFPDFEVEEIDYNTEEGLSTIKELGIEMLPAFIFDENIEISEKFTELNQIFTKKGKTYILNSEVAGSTYYTSAENIPNKLELFIADGQLSSEKAKKNAEEFARAGVNDVIFSVHDTSSTRAKEMKIKNTPAFVINNKIKLVGVYSPETIKENFCKFNNNAEVCKISLSTKI